VWTSCEETFPSRAVQISGATCPFAPETQAGLERFQLALVTPAKATAARRPSSVLPQMVTGARHDVAMFAALEDLLHQKRYARRSKRLAKAFPLLYSDDNGSSWHPAYGLDMSLGGMRVFSRAPLPGGEVPVRVTLGTTVVDLRARPVWHLPGIYHGQPAHEYGMQLVAATATARERIARWVGELPLEEQNLAAEQLKAIRLRPDDVNRLLPLAFQQRLFAELQRRGRLGAVDRAHPALVAYDYGGSVRYRGAPMHRLTIHSKVVRGDNEDRYVTRLLFDGTGSRVLFLS